MIDPSIVVIIPMRIPNTHFFPELKNGDISRVGSFNNFLIKNDNDFTFIVLIGAKTANHTEDSSLGQAHARWRYRGSNGTWGETARMQQ